MRSGSAPRAGPRRFGGAAAPGPGFEPGSDGSEPSVLPLDESGTCQSMSVMVAIRRRGDSQSPGPRLVMSERAIGPPGRPGAAMEVTFRRPAHRSNRRTMWKWSGWWGVQELHLGGSEDGGSTGRPVSLAVYRPGRWGSDRSEAEVGCESIAGEWFERSVGVVRAARQARSSGGRTLGGRWRPRWPKAEIEKGHRGVTQVALSPQRRETRATSGGPPGKYPWR